MENITVESTPQTSVSIEGFLEGIINGGAGFKVWEDREFVVHQDRDVAIAAWVIRCLANPRNKDTEYVLTAIQEQREKASVTL